MVHVRVSPILMPQNTRKQYSLSNIHNFILTRDLWDGVICKQEFGFGPLFTPTSASSQLCCIFGRKDGHYEVLSLHHVEGMAL